MSRTSTLKDVKVLAAMVLPSWPAINRRIDASGAPTCRVAEGSLQSKLQDIEGDLREVREERAVLLRERDKARAAWAQSPNTDPTSSVFKRAQKATEDLADCDKRIDDIRTAQEGTLRMLGQHGNHAAGGRHGNGPRNPDGAAGDGWGHVARDLNLAEGRNRVDVRTADLLHEPYAAGFNVTPGEGLSAPTVVMPFSQMAQPRQFLYPVFGRELVEDGDLALTDWKQVGTRKVTGDVERDPISTDPKAKLELSIELATPSLKQWAAYIDEVPSKLFSAIDAFEAFLQSELAYQLQLAVDAHCIAGILAAAPPAGETGTTLIEQARNAVAAMRGLGANPTVLALNPTDAAALDVQKSGSEGLEQYIFASRDTGSASPLWGSTIVEVANLTDPLLIDPALLGVLYQGNASVLVDPFTGLDTNEVRVRVEADGLLHVRDIAGAYVIAKEP